MAENDREPPQGLGAYMMQLMGSGKDTELLETKLRADLVEPQVVRRSAPPPGFTGSRESEFARILIAERRLRDGVLGADLFGEPVWDMLLDLFVAHEEQERVSVSSLCIAAAVPATTALRWVNHLVKREMIIRWPDPTDGRRVWIALSPHMVSEMRRLLKVWMAKEK
jgi:hypothetical protein